MKVFALFDAVSGDYVEAGGEPYIVKAHTVAEAAELFCQLDEIKTNNPSYLYFDEKHKIILDSFDDCAEMRGFVGLIEVIGKDN